ncbi:VCBS repeat-containing protein [Arenibacter amylolyticus]|uniref:VCBS repeat-containing protein n=1 Tax=Arenibacter amylolyticus TaxID=1406873 RepID=UPI000A389BB5|nr:VCBS repeat-containing protein [Arenibacter amylolyticus]
MKKTLLSILVIGCFLGCNNTDPSKAKAPIYFETVPESVSGVNFTNQLHSNDSLNIISYLYYYNGGGVAVGDINNDGLEDLFFTANELPDRLYLNLGDLKFKDITQSANIKMDATWSTGATMADVNNDGFLDIYISKVGNYKNLQSHNRLYLNNGDNTFTEVSTSVGLDFSGFSTQAVFFDYDGDGDLDMYLMNHSIHSNRSYGKVDKRMEKDALAGDRLYENKLESGTLYFEDVTEQAGIYNSPLGYGLAVIATDLNQDGLMDLYVGNDFHENDYIYINQGDKTFKEVGEEWFNHSSRFTMGVDVGDMNNNGRQDLFTLDMMPFQHNIFLKSGGEDSDKVSKIKEHFGFGTQYARNHFQLNNGDNTFSDIALMTQTHATDWSWSVLMEDFDNDGLKDIFVTNGIYKRPNDLDYINYLSSTDFSQYNQNKSAQMEQKLIAAMPSLKIPNMIFHNKGNFDYASYAEEAGFNPSYSNGAATVDLDNDGDMDLVVNNLNEMAVILENKSDQNSNSWIGVQLRGSQEKPLTLGAKVTVYSNGEQFYKELITTRGFQSSSSHKLHFGLGMATSIDSLTVLWPDGMQQVVKGLEPQQYHTIERDASAVLAEQQPQQQPEFVAKVFPYTHRENTYYDYELEPLMPEKLSQEGPAVVVADFNSDGLDDIFIGGAKYQSATLFIQQADGSFTTSFRATFDSDKLYEDVGAVAFDLDNDGDLDLYVMSGGNDVPEGDTYLEDRVYLNDGKGNFERLKASLPKTNGGSIAAADFNKDGFTDLFIGSRSIPGGYGLSPLSIILKNTGNNNFEIVESGPYGMITDSQWADLNNDGYLDLIMVGDWMPITVLMNNGDNTFSNQTKALGLEHTAGMWNTVLVADLDGNGHLDIAAGNAGLNFKWKASPTQPVKLYIDDFDENEQSDPIIFYDYFGHQVPFASLDQLKRQLPMLQKKFLSYTDFSKIKNIEDLTGKKESDIVEVKQIMELRSMVYMNTGNGFTATPLPKEAQMSTIEGFYLDEELDDPALFFVGNYKGYVNELGQSMANPGGVLRNFKDNQFTSYKRLPLPKGISVRSIKKIDKYTYLVISNNAEAYTLEMK